MNRPIAAEHRSLRSALARLAELADRLHLHVAGCQCASCTDLADATRHARIVLERVPAIGNPGRPRKGEELAHKLRDPKFYTARTKRAVNSRGAL